jgi:YidC/Oxa1 family membrane protein insertase
MLGSGNENPMGTRVILAFLISFVILFGYSYFSQKYFPPKPLQETVQHDIESVTENRESPSLEEPKVRQDIDTWPDEKEVVLESSLMKVTFSSLRGSIKSLLLKTTPPIRDKEVRLVEFQNPDVQPGALSRVGDLPHRSLLSYKIVEQGSDYVLFEASYKKLTIQKRFSLRENYAVELEIQFSNARKKSYSLYRGYDLSIGSMKAQHLDEELRPEEVAYFLAGGTGAYLKKPVRKIRDRAVEDLEISWAAIKSKYFVLAAKPIESAAFSLITEGVEENFQLYYACALRMESFLLESGKTHKDKFFVYCGPKDYDILKSFGFHLESLLDFEGIWGSLCRGLVASLQGLNRIFHNYGIAIIVLTILLKFLFYPLSAISLRSMKEMQALKPQLDEIRKKNKDNPKKMQQATMALYKEHNVKPLAGCLPMLVQIPIFIAFYKMLMVSFELRGADFLWINDLARPDTIVRLGGFPLNILPILNGASMYWQQKLTPTDPSQKMFKYLMPVMITVFFYNLPSGLILYWLITTLVTVLQQYQVQKSPGRKANTKKS